MTENLPNGRSSSISVTVQVQDENDNNPVFLASGYLSVLAEDDYSTNPQTLSNVGFKYNPLNAFIMLLCPGINRSGACSFWPVCLSAKTFTLTIDFHGK